MPQIYINDQPVEFEPGEKVLEIAKKAGTEIPHYCYHPALSIVATCRMCLVDIQDMGNGRPAPKLMTSCSTEAADGMKISTQTPKVKEAREMVMEMLLLNHPLDCPICDQSGECSLQNYSNQYGSGRSEMEYAKRVYGWRNIGTFVTLERNRCIHCTRCERFTKEITETNEIGVFNRNHQLTVDTYHDSEMVNLFQGNLADICPVGAITEREFRFKKRVWFLKKTPSICTGCSTGCNTSIEVDKNKIYRIKPRENQEVNKWWMCDKGRLAHNKLNSHKDRIMSPQGRSSGHLIQTGWEDIQNALMEVLQDFSASPSEVTVLTDTYSTIEEMYALQTFMKETFQSDQVFFPKRSWIEYDTGRFIDSIITNDKTPNQAGAIALGLKGDEADNQIQTSLESDTKLLIVVGNPLKDNPDLRKKFSTVPLIIWIGDFINEWVNMADVVLPGQTAVEKRGLFLNKHSRLQQFEMAIHAPEKTKSQWKIISILFSLFGKNAPWQTHDELLKHLEQHQPAWKNLHSLPEQGLALQLSQTNSQHYTRSSIQ